MDLHVNNISFAYNGSPVLDKICLTMTDGEMLGIIGPNGSGKTTLLKCINNKLKPDVGTVLVDDQNILDMNRKEIARTIGVVPQVSSVSFPFTVYDLVMMGRYSHKKRFETENKTDRDIVHQCLECTGISHMAKRYITEISGGEYQRVIVARALAQQPKILLLDEVTLHLDINHQIEILDLVKNLCMEQELAVAIVLHDLSLAARYSTKTIMLQNGRIASFGMPDEVITVENIRNVYGIEAEIGRTSNGDFLNVIPISLLDTKKNKSDSVAKK